MEQNQCPNQNHICEECRYFRRHYVKFGRNRYHPISKGHCVHPRLKDRSVDTPACPRFSFRREAED